MITLIDLPGKHDRDAFDSGSAPLDQWLTQTTMYLLCRLAPAKSGPVSTSS